MMRSSRYAVLWRGLVLVVALVAGVCCGTNPIDPAGGPADVGPGSADATAAHGDGGFVDARFDANEPADADPQPDAATDVDRGPVPDADPRPDTGLVDDAGVGECPVVGVRCRVVGDDAWSSETLEARFADRVECEPVLRDGADPPARVSWEMVERPAGSTAPIIDPTAFTAVFDLDTSGRWVVRLIVFDDADADAGVCAYFGMSVRTGSDTALRVDVVWRTPADPDETDSGFGAGSDVDVHLLHPNGCWGDTQWDCHWRAQEPHWGDPGTPGRGPSMDIDDSDGAGPEIVRYDEPEDGVRYRVGVHLYNDHGFGAVYATVRIYLFGTIVFEQEKELPARDAFWEVATVSWPDGEIMVLDAVHPSTPTCD